MDLLNHIVSENHDEIIRMHNHGCLYMLTGSFDPAIWVPFQFLYPWWCMYVCICVYAYVVTQIMYKYIFTHTYVCSYVYICDCLCENPPYLHANFDLIFMV